MLLTTHRLTLVACPLDVGQALLTAPRQAEKLLGAALPSRWPSPELEGILSLYIQELLHDPEALGWGIWIAVLTEQNVVVGDAGFKGRPDATGTVEIGYGVVPAYRRRGYATEAVQALVAWALAHPEVRRIVAECAPENTASIRVLTELGFRSLPAPAGMLCWELEPDRSTAGRS